MNEVTGNKIIETKQTFYKPSGGVAEMTISEAAAELMNEHYPTLGEKGISFPEQAVDFGLSTQAPLLTDEEVEQVVESLDTSEKHKFQGFMKTKVKKGAVSEIEVFNFVKKSEDKLLMTTYWSYVQSCLQKLLGIEQKIKK